MTIGPVRWMGGAAPAAGHDAGLRNVAVRLALQTVGLVFVMLVVLGVVAYLITQQTLVGSLENTLRARGYPPSDFVAHIYNVPGQYSYGPSGNGAGNPGQSGNHGYPPPPGGGNGNGSGHGSGNQPGGFGNGPGGPPGSNPDQNPSDASTVYVTPNLHIVHADGALGQVLLDGAAVKQAIAARQPQCCDVRQYKGDDYLIYTNPITYNGKIVGAVQASISEHQYENTMHSLLQALLMVLLLGLVGAGGVSVVLVQRALQPIRRAIQRQRDFVADAAHELRTPLAIQRTTAEVALSDGAGTGYAETVEQMLVENRHLTRLVDDLSLLARADSNAVAINRAPMDLSALVADTAIELEPLAEERGMRLTVDVSPGIWVEGDLMRLRQLLLVLLDNALKYTPAGGSVTVRLHARNGRAQLQVQDSGPGIAPADLPHIFDRFYRADRARTGEGSGLGLAIARWIVDAHGGTLQAGNASPHGAIFTASLPATVRTRAVETVSGHL